MNQLTKSDYSLSQKISNGAFWVTFATLTGRSLSVVSAIILARLLSPSDFGLMAIAMAIITFSQGTTQTGFESAIIQMQDKHEDFLNTAWTFELVRYLILFIITFTAAPVLATLFNEPVAANILRIISLTFIFQGLRNIGIVFFRKNLDFKKQFIVEIVPMIINIFVVIPLAFILRNVWALVWAGLTSSLFTFLISYVMHPYRPRLDFNLSRAKILFSFGKWILGSAIVGMVNEQGMTMFIGKFLGTPVLGFYNRAGVFSTSIFQQISEIVWKVGYPAYTKLQNEVDRFRKAFLKTLQLLTFIGIPMAGGLFVLSYDFVHLFLTDKWMPIVPLIRILCVQSVFNFINTPASIAFQATGKPSIGTKVSAFGTLIVAISVYPLAKQWGVTGAVLSLFLSVLLTSPVLWYKATKLINCSFSEFVRPVIYPLLSTIIMCITIVILKDYNFFGIGFVHFGLLVVIGIVTYLSIVFLLDKITDYGILQLIKDRIVFWR